MLLQLGSIPTLVISSAEVAGKIFKPHDLIFSGRPGLYAAKRLSYEFNDISFAPYGEYWREIRKIAILELLSTKRVNSFQPVRKEEVNTVIESITRTSNINLSELMLSLANNVICRVAYGKKFDGTNKAKNYEILKETQRLLGELNVADFYPWFGWFLNKVNGVDARLEKNFKELDEFYDEVIQEHVDGSRNYGEDDEDFVDVLLKLQKDPNQTIALNNDQIKGSIPTLVISSAEIAREIFKPHDLIFSSRPGLYAAKRLSYEFHDITFAPYGEYWREVRKITILELLCMKRVNSFQPVRNDEVNVVIESITRLGNVNLSELMLSLTNNVICRVAYGKKFDGSKSKSYEILKETERLLGELNIADYCPWVGWFLNKVNGVDVRLEKNFKELDEFYDEVIQEHIGGSRNSRDDHEDFVDVLLKLQKDPNQTIALNYNQIKGIITVCFLAPNKFMPIIYFIFPLYIHVTTEMIE
ncbi:hypothetical protein SOVF_084560 [Spinacia oleracea]|nr:hypothetical protein SOVF_084560 [Spinacia oleracea]